MDLARTHGQAANRKARKAGLSAACRLAAAVRGWAVWGEGWRQAG